MADEQIPQQANPQGGAQGAQGGQFQQRHPRPVVAHALAEATLHQPLGIWQPQARGQVDEPLLRQT